MFFFLLLSLCILMWGHQMFYYIDLTFRGEIIGDFFLNHIDRWLGNYLYQVFYFVPLNDFKIIVTTDLYQVLIG